MQTRYRNILIVLFLLFAAAFVGLRGVFHDLSNEYAVGEAKKQALNALLVHRATHAYVTQIQRPEIYRLKSEGKLYQEYFSPQVMSFTFISRSIKDLLNQEREKHDLEPIYFKLASENARNPVNQADANELALLRQMNGNNQKEFEQVVEFAGRKWLYLAVPIERSDAGCMKCHGDPADAPAELVAMYGDKAGFHEQPDTIRALISIRVPFQSIVKAGDRMADALTLVTFLVLASIYLVIAFLIRRIDAQQQKILQHNKELEQLSETDLLTGVLNRFGLQKRSNEIISRANRFRHPVALLMLDLDYFKTVNDKHGHLVGDAVLKSFADAILANMRASDIFGRWGGEEFLVIAPHLNIGEAAVMAEKFRHVIESVDFASGVHLTASIGISAYRAGESATELIARADHALYVAKQNGRNRVVVESDDTQSALAAAVS